MPGKQMAIDADLSSGLIDEAQARIRRSKIQREADFFGAMDGATKFVKGDAIMSLITTLINLVGGVIVGFVTGVGDYGHLFDRYGGRWIDVADSCAADFSGDRHDRYPFRIRIEP